MKKSTPSNPVRKETAVAASTTYRGDHLSFVNAVSNFFGEEGQPSFDSAKQTTLLQVCERFLEHNGQGSHRRID
jgi:hypothetical protein